MDLLRAIQVFKVVTQQQSFSAAARELNPANRMMRPALRALIDHLLANYPTTGDEPYRRF